MEPRKLLPGIALGWAAAGVVFAAMASGDLESWPILLIAATVVGPALALGAAHAARLDRVRLSGALLILSAIVTPSYFFLGAATVPFVAGLSNLVLGGLTPARRLRFVVEKGVL